MTFQQKLKCFKSW